MPKPFSWPVVKELKEGDTCLIAASPSEAKRKIAEYGARANKRFSLELEGCELNGYITATRVTRLPVTDSDLPGA